MVGTAFAVCAPQPVQTADDVKGGLRPWSIDLSHLGASYRAQTKKGARLADAQPLPTRWDSRDKGWVAPIRNQGGHNICWAFSTMACLEAIELKETGAANDYSENHLAAHDVGFSWGYEDGGNNQIAAALLTSWRDPLMEVQDPFVPYGNSPSLTNAPSVCHVQEIVWLPKRPRQSTVTDPTETASVDALLKQAVMDYGAVSIGYMHLQSCYSSSLGSYYLKNYKTATVNSLTDGGHAVALIGWDDDYPATNFRETPPGNGAFLCKNSWGPTAGTNGCLWISYHDDYFAYMASAAYPRPQTTNNYGRIYQYDQVGQTLNWNVYEDAADEARGGKTNWCANVFTASVTGIVSAVGFYALSAGTEYELRVYADCGTTPDTGTLVSSQEGVLPNAGYFTLPLANEVPITRPAERFAIALRLETPENFYPIPVACNTYSGGALYATNVLHAGESFLSPDGWNWTDFKVFPGATHTENICIKAYTKFGFDGAPRGTMIRFR